VCCGMLLVCVQKIYSCLMLTAFGACVRELVLSSFGVCEDIYCCLVLTAFVVCARQLVLSAADCF